jgi:hypothetical protein
MMSKEKDVVDYIVEWEDDLKTPDTLFRYIRNEKGYWCESLSALDNGQWDYTGMYGLDLLLDTHNELYDRVTKEEAEKIAEQLGGSIYKD